MVDSRWLDFAGQAIFHTLIAALVVEALVRLWGVRQPAQRTALRAVALLWPFVAVPALFVAFPAREGEAFRDGPALFAGRHWDGLAFLGVGLYVWWVGAMATAGMALFLMDLVPLLRARADEPPSSPPTTPAGRRAASALAEVLAASGSRGEPPLVYLDGGPPLLYCTGARHPVVVVSRAAVDLLDDGELRGALAHEIAHLDRRDPAVSWVVMGLRSLQWFNPAFQVLARAMARDAERGADERASRATGDRVALASGLLKLFRATEGRPLPAARRHLPLTAALAEPIARARTHDIAARCRSLLGPPPEPLPFGPARIAAAGAALFLLLFFVV
jgi:Zn-dependent protease with chaperone function